MDFCCLAIGCSNQTKLEDGTAHVCPRCHNGSVYAAKETRCLDICCVPLVPLGSSHVWACNICQWQASQNGPAPPIAGPQGPPQQGGYAGGGYGGGGYGMQAPMGYPQQAQQPGYQPGYPH